MLPWTLGYPKIGNLFPVRMSAHSHTVTKQSASPAVTQAHSELVTQFQPVSQTARHSFKQLDSRNHTVIHIYSDTVNNSASQESSLVTP